MVKLNAAVSEWDKRFLELAAHVSTWSKDPSTQVGAVLVSPDRKHIVIGYNGFPSGMEDREEWLLNKEEKYSRVIHAEMNAILNAGKPVKGYTLYVWPFPVCDRCSVFVIQAGIAKVISPRLPAGKYHWAKSINRSSEYLDKSGIEIIAI